MISKVDYEKAYKSLSWEYLDHILLAFGFGATWRGRITQCLSTVRASILIDESPTEEFLLCRGVRQFEPLSHFLFILAKKGLTLL